MHKKVIIGYMKGPFELPGPALIVYETNNRFYVKGNYTPAIRINRGDIDLMIMKGEYIREPRELYLNNGLKAFALDNNMVLVGYKDELIRRLAEVAPEMPKDQNYKIMNWIINTFPQNYTINRS